jgi:hypothetical protein
MWLRHPRQPPWPRDLCPVQRAGIAHEIEDRPVNFPHRQSAVRKAILTVALATGAAVSTTSCQPALSPPAAAAAGNTSVPAVASHAAGAGTGTGAGSRSRLPNGEVLYAGIALLPNRAKTPGSADPAVTQANIHQTICLTGYTKTVRPPSSYTTNLKRSQLTSGYAYRGDTNLRDYEEDHLIPLEIGGNPSSTANLWPEPSNVAAGSKLKDQLENKLHDLVCSGQVPLAVAQQADATNWYVAYQRYGGEAMPHVYDGRYRR